MNKLTVLPLAFSCFSFPGLEAQTSQQAVHAPDAGTFEMVTSISIPPTPRAPFSATVSTEWVRTLEDGSTITLENHRLVTRDSAGRIYQERRRFVARGQEPQITRIEISDPSTHKQFFCYPDSHTCQVHGYFAPTSVETTAQEPAEEGSSLTREDLGVNNISSLDAVGTRETRTIAAGVMGNDRALSVIKEFWYSPQLAINLMVKRIDPRHGTQTFTVSNIGLAEPEPRWFSIPEGYMVLDQHSAKRAAVNPAAASAN
jgi:hypothetical protein